MRRERIRDTTPPDRQTIEVTVDGEKVPAVPGEAVLSTLFAIGKRTISKNDHGVVTGAYCGMGICYCCLVRIDGIVKQRACQVEVREGMSIQTQKNVYDVLKPVAKGESRGKSD